MDRDATPVSDGAAPHTGLRWVLLEPPTAPARFWRRALAVALLVVGVLLVAWYPDGMQGRSAVMWALVGVGLMVSAVGCCWLRVAATRPRPITREIDRVLAGRSWVERRRLENALRAGEPLDEIDRPAAAALTARAQSALADTGATLGLLGALTLLMAHSVSGVAGRLLLAYYGALCLLALHRTRRSRPLRRAAIRAGVDPLVADAPPPSPRVPGSSPRFGGTSRR